MAIRMRKAWWGAAALAVAATACGGGTPAPVNEQPAATAPALSPWTAAVEALPLPVQGSSGQPQLTSSARGVILSWLEHRENGATLKFSERSGGTWSPARTVASSPDWFVSWADVPTVLRMSDGTLVATSYPATDPAIEAYDLRLSYSRDDGKTWAAPLAPHHDDTRTQHGFASLFELPDKSLGLVWLDGRDQELNTTDPNGGAMGLYFGRFDQRFKQVDEKLVNGRVCECCLTTTAVTDDGVVAAFRDRTPREIRDINVTRLDDAGWSPERPVHVDGWEIEACPVNGPALSARGRQVAVAWFTAPDEKGQALAAFSSDAGRTWGEPIRLDDGVARGQVDVELLPDGSAVATWVELVNERSRLRLRRVEPSGARSAVIDVAGSGGGVSGIPRIVHAGNELLITWTQTAADGDGSEQVYGAVVKNP